MVEYDSKTPNNRNLKLLSNLNSYSSAKPIKSVGIKRSLKELTLLAMEQEDELRRTKELRLTLKEQDRLTYRIKYSLQLFDCLQNACKHHKPSKLKKCTFEMSELIDIIYTQYSQFISLLIIDDENRGIKSEVKYMIKLLCDHVPEFIQIENCSYLFEDCNVQARNSRNEYVHIYLNCDLVGARKKLTELGYISDQFSSTTEQPIDKPLDINVTTEVDDEKLLPGTQTE